MSFLQIAAKAGEVASTPRQQTGGRGSQLSLEDQMALGEYKISLADRTERMKYKYKRKHERDKFFFEQKTELAKFQWKTRHDRQQNQITYNNNIAKYHLKNWNETSKNWFKDTGNSNTPVPYELIEAAHRSPQWAGTIFSAIGGYRKVDPSSKEYKDSNLGYILLDKNRKWAKLGGTLENHHSTMALLDLDKENYNKHLESLKDGIPRLGKGVEYIPTGQKGVFQYRIAKNNPIGESLTRYEAVAGLGKKRKYEVYSKFTKERINNNIKGSSEKPNIVKHLNPQETQNYAGKGFYDLEERETFEGTYRPVTKIRKGSLNQNQQDMQQTIIKQVNRVAKANKKSLGRHHMAVILANSYAESSFNPDSLGDSGVSYGLFQINIGPKGTPNLPLEIKENLFEPETNIHQILTNINGGALNNKEFMEADTYEKANEIFVKQILKPKDAAKKIKVRQGYASQFFNAFVEKAKPVQVASADKGFVVPKEKLGESAKSTTTEEAYNSNVSKLPPLQRMTKVLSEETNLMPTSISDKFIGENINTTGLYPKDHPLWKHVLPNSEPAVIGAAVRLMHNQVVSKKLEMALAEKKKENTRKDNEARGKTSVKINGKSDFTNSGGVSKKIPPITNILDKKVKENLDNEVKAGRNKGLRAGATELDVSLTQLAIYEKYLQHYLPDAIWNAKTGKYESTDKTSSLAKQAADVAWATEFRQKFLDSHRGPILTAIQTSASPKSKHSFTYMSYGPDMFPLLSGDESIRTEFGTVAPKIDKIIKSEAFRKKYSVNVSNVSIDGKTATKIEVTPKRPPTTREWKLHRQFIPGSDNNDAMIGTGYLGLDSIGVRALTPGNRIVDGTKKENEPDSDEIIRVNAELEKLRKLAANVLDAPNSSPAFSKLYSFIQQSRDFKKFEGLQDELVKGLAYNQLLRSIKQRSKSHDTNYAGINFPGYRLLEGHRLSEEEHSKTSAAKDFSQLRSYFPNLLALADSTLGGFKEAGAMGIMNKNLGPARNLMRDTILQSVRENYTEKGTEAQRFVGYLESVANGDTIDSNVSKQDAEEFLGIIKTEGGKQLSSLPQVADKLMTTLGTVGAFIERLAAFKLNDVNTFKNLKNYQWDQGDQFVYDKGSDSYRRLSSDELDKPGIVPQKHRNYDSELHTIKDKDKKFAILEQKRKEASETLVRDLERAGNNASARTKALLNARRMFNAITMTYMYAGMVQGGSGGRAISNEDFEHLWDALWSGTGGIQNYNLENARNILQASFERAKILNDASYHGDAVANEVLSAVMPFQRKLLYKKNEKITKQHRDSIIGGDPNTNVDGSKVPVNPEVNQAAHRVIQNNVKKNNFLIKDTVKSPCCWDNNSMVAISDVIEELATAEDMTLDDGNIVPVSFLSPIHSEIMNKDNLSGDQILRAFMSKGQDDNKDYLYNILDQFKGFARKYPKLIFYNGSQLQLEESHPRHLGINVMRTYSGTSMAEIVDKMEDVTDKGEDPYRQHFKHIFMQWAADILTVAARRYKVKASESPDRYPDPLQFNIQPF